MADTAPNHAWQDVADDVTSAIEKAVQPLLRKAVDDIYAGLLDATQDYLKDNLAFNIASRISAAERDAIEAGQLIRPLAGALDSLLSALSVLSVMGRPIASLDTGLADAITNAVIARAAIPKAFA